MNSSSGIVKEWIYNKLIELGVSESVATVIDGLLIIVFVLAIVLLSNAIVNWGVIRVVQRIVRWTSVKWDDILFDKHVMDSLGRVVTPVTIMLLLPMIDSAFDIERAWISELISRGVSVYIIVTTLLLVNALVRALFELLGQRQGWQGKPIKGLLQTAQVILFIIGVILVVSAIVDKSPAMFLTGLGASAAVVSFIFKDSLMGFMAGIQLSANNMLKVGDWIEMPSRGIDGTVIEVSLTTVKIRNWSNTIQTIPPYMLISEPFDNWQAMRDSGGRRIKRSLNIDTTCVHFVSEGLLERLLHDPATSRFMSGISGNSIEGEPLTNLDLFMRCVKSYIDSHPRVNHTMMVLVRQLQPSEFGVPIEIYCFSADVNWVPYEHLQAELVSHIVALAPLFGLRLYQAPSTLDLRA